MTKHPQRQRLAQVRASQPEVEDGFPRQPLGWRIDLHTLSPRGSSRTFAATAVERAELAEILNLVSCEALTLAVEVNRPGDDVYFVHGEIEAKLVQSCVITLEPVAAQVRSTFEVELRPPARIPEAHGAVTVGEEADLEPLDGNAIPIGRLVFEEFASVLDPYPRKTGAEFVAASTPGIASRGVVMAHGPFAALAKLKEKK